LRLQLTNFLLQLDGVMLQKRQWGGHEQWLGCGQMQKEA
jgi:hypothetical protein